MLVAVADKLLSTIGALNNFLVGITLADEQGKHPKGPCTWQFNFKFSLNEDMYAQVRSIC